MVYCGSRCSTRQTGAGRLKDSMAEQTNSRFRAGEVAAELRAINARLDEIVANQTGIASWQLDVVRYMATSNERVDTLRRDLGRSDRIVGAIAVIVSAVFSSIAGWFGSRQYVF